MRLVLAFLAGLICEPALAAGGLNCAADGEGVSFDVGGGVTHGMGGSLFSFAGKVTASGAGIGADLTQGEFAREHVAQYWLDGEELRLLLYRERGGDAPHGFVELTIRAVASGEADEGVYAGRYALTLFDMTGDGGSEGITVDHEGDVECLVE